MLKSATFLTIVDGKGEKSRHIPTILSNTGSLFEETCTAKIQMTMVGQAAKHL
jgi:hypothetical protein